MFSLSAGIRKYLKAFLIYKGQKILKTHSIDYLLELCSSADADFITIDAGNIDDFAVEIRYPDSFLSPDLSETEKYLKIALHIKILVESKIKFQ